MAAAPRYWNDARRIHAGKPCRVCGLGNEIGRRIELAHVIGRSHDAETMCPVCFGSGTNNPAATGGTLPCVACKGQGRVRAVHPLDVVPLCSVTIGKTSDGCHWRYDAHGLDLLPYLTIAEQAHAVALVGIVSALHRLTGQHWVMPTVHRKEN